MKLLAVFFGLITVAKGTFLLPLLLYSLLNPVQHKGGGCNDHGHSYDSHHKENFTTHHEDDSHQVYYQSYKIIKLDPPEVKVLPGIVKIRQSVVKVKVEKGKDKPDDDNYKDDDNHTASN